MIKIKDLRKSQRSKLSKLKAGDVFEYHDTMYLKIVSQDQDLYAVDLQTMEGTRFLHDLEVRQLEAELKISGSKVW